MNNQTMLKYPKQLKLTYQKKVVGDVREICNPIFEFLGITFFSHTRAFHDGAFTCLLSSTELTEYYLEKKYPINFSHGRGIDLDSGMYVAEYISNDSSKNIRILLREKFNVDHFFYIVEKQKNHDDFYAFATTPENVSIINRYLNQRAFLYQFLLYYKDQARLLLKNSDTIIYSKEYFAVHHEPKTCLINNDKEKYELLAKHMPIKKLQLLGYGGETTISGQEYECLKYIVKSYTIKEIGKFLGLSPRTIETYVNNLKHKLNCSSRSQLINIIAMNRHLFPYI